MKKSENSHASGVRDGAEHDPAVENRLMTSLEVAKMLRVDQSSVNNWVRTGKLRSCKTPGGHNRIEESALRRFLMQSGMSVPSSLRARAPHRVLVVDDDPIELRRWRHHLDVMDGLVELRCADNGISGLVQVGAFRPHLVVLDYVMPGLDGLEVCARLRSIPELQDTCVVLVSRAMTPEISARAREAGALAAYDKFQSINTFLELLGISPAVLE